MSRSPSMLSKLLSPTFTRIISSVTEQELENSPSDWIRQIPIVMAALLKIIYDQLRVAAVNLGLWGE